MHIIALITSILITRTLQSDCTLPHGRTAGECVHIKNCKSQLGRFRVDATVTRCSGGKGFVCCPLTESVSERKCSEWREMLHAPVSFTQPRLEKPMCANGDELNFIVGGRNAAPYEYPHAVSLGYGSDPNKLKYLCGATLISERFLVTAAHCLTSRVGKPTYAILGDIILDPVKENTNPSPYRKVVRISEHIVHPLYKPPLIYNDIALLTLSTPLDLSRYVLPACIGTPSTTPITNPKKHAQVEACGWGITDITTQKTSNILKAINISTVDTGTCNSIYGLEPDKGYRYPDGVRKTQICATGEDKDTCRGDSGGGLYIRESKCLFHIIGVTSIGSKVCGLGSPAIYTTIASYQDWIESTVWG